ncbi:MAG: AraC family transcriptional regulator [Rikenellaceae bacterium]
MERFSIANMSIERIKESAESYLVFEQDVLICILSGEHAFEFPIRAEQGVIVCTEGEAELSINNKIHKLSKGVMMFNFPVNVLQSKYRSSDFKAKVIFFSEEFSKSTLATLKYVTANIVRFKRNPCVNLSPLAIDMFDRYFDLLTFVMKNDIGGRKKDSLSSLMMSLSASIDSEMEKYYKEEDTNEVNSRSNQIFYDFMTLLNENYMKERRVSFYAEKFYLTPKYFSSIIKQASLRSASEWIDEIVMIESQSLLRYTNLSIQEVSDRLNFPNSSFFGKYFKQHSGSSPGQYRKRWTINKGEV